jgi:hypothetical protein
LRIKLLVLLLWFYFHVCQSITYREMTIKSSQGIKRYSTVPSIRRQRQKRKSIPWSNWYQLPIFQSFLQVQCISCWVSKFLAQSVTDRHLAKQEDGNFASLYGIELTGRKARRTLIDTTTEEMKVFK